MNNCSYPEYVSQTQSVVNVNNISGRCTHMAFIRKVYCTFILELAVVFASVCLFLYCEPINEYFRHNPSLMTIGIIAFIMVSFVIICCGNRRHTFPLNFICLFFLTIAESYVIGVYVSMQSIQDADIMHMAGICAFTSLGIIALTFRNKGNWSVINEMLIVAVLTLFYLGFVTIFLYKKIVTLSSACVGGLIFLLINIVVTRALVREDARPLIEVSVAPTYPSQPPTYPPQPIIYPTQSPTYPSQSLAYTPQPLAYPPQPPAYSPQPPAYSPQPLAYPPQPASNPAYPTYPAQCVSSF